MTIATRNLTAALALAFLTTALVGCSDDGTTGPDTSAPVLRSSFEEGLGGWLATGDYENLETRRTNPVQGRYLMAFDEAEGQTWYFVAPSMFRGDKSRYYGGTISYYLRGGFRNGRAIAASDYFGAPDIKITGAGMTILFRWSIMAYPYPEGFREMFATLRPGPNWRRADNGELVTEEEMRDVLGDVGRIEIRGEYLTGEDYGMMDEFTLAGP